MSAWTRLRELSRAVWLQRLYKWAESYKWAIVGWMWGIAAGLGYIGFWKFFAAKGEPRTFWDLSYLTLQLFTLESGSVAGDLCWELETARFLAPVAALYTAVQALALLFNEQYRRLRLRFYRDHVVICGLGRRGLLLAREFCRRGHRVVVIEQDADNDRVEQCRDLGAVVLIGDATDSQTLEGARTPSARYLLAVCGDDGVNTEIAIDARRITESRIGREPLHCVVQIVDAHLLNLLRRQEMSIAKHGAFTLEFFNGYERAARAVLADHPPFSRSGEKRPHILVVGVGRMGESLIVHAARSWRNFRQSADDHLDVTIVDKDSLVKRELLRLHFPALDKMCHFRVIDLDVSSPDFYRAAFLSDDEGSEDVSAVYVCLDNDSRAMSAALALLEKTRGKNIPIVVRMSREQGLAELLQSVDAGRSDPGRLYTFGVLERTCIPELIVGGTHEIIARAIHEEYRARTAALKAAAGRRRPDPAAAAWDHLAEPYRAAFRREADHVGAKLKAVNCAIEPLSDWEADMFEFTPEEIETIAKKEYDRCMEARYTGQLIYFPGYDALPGFAETTRPPWNSQSNDVKDSYRRIVRQIPAFLARSDFQICR
jgi:hypothetical protein